MLIADGGEVTFEATLKGCSWRLMGMVQLSAVQKGVICKTRVLAFGTLSLEGPWKKHLEKQA